MNYDDCLEACVSTLRQDATPAAERDISIYLSYPIPCEREWTDILQAIAEGGGDAEDPFDCIGTYEIRLSKLGYPSPLADYVSKLQAAARDGGIPAEFVDDAVALF